MITVQSDPELVWDVAARPLPGQIVSGDHHLVEQTLNGWLLAVADGLGHGPEAAAATAIFMEVLIGNLDETPINLIRLGHEALKTSRGIACTIISINSRQSLLSWVGVGNVEGIVHRLAPRGPSTEYVTMRGGIVGYRLPELKESSLRLQSGDFIILATDGIAGDFVNIISSFHPPKVIANRILGRYAKDQDDALILVARWQPHLERKSVSAS